MRVKANVKPSGGPTNGGLDLHMWGPSLIGTGSYAPLRSLETEEATNGPAAV